VTTKRVVVYQGEVLWEGAADDFWDALAQFEGDSPDHPVLKLTIPVVDRPYNPSEPDDALHICIAVEPRGGEAGHA
jgi:hypothetical protein